MAHLVAIGLAKNVFQLHGVDDRGAALFRKKLRREQMLDFFGRMEPTQVAMEACATAHWLAVGLPEIGLQTRHLRIAQPEKIRHVTALIFGGESRCSAEINGSRAYGSPRPLKAYS